jgi:hypothetical protein
MLMFFEYVQKYFLHRFNQFDFLPFMLSSFWIFLGKLTSFCECNIVT